ncbi:MAG: tellurite resistance TerB family protein [Pseudomonadota bacterium]
MIEQLLGGLGGGGQGHGNQVGQGVQGAMSKFPGGAGGAAAAAGVAGLLLGSKKGRKMMSKGMKYGGLAVLGGLAYRAWQQHQSGGGAGGGQGGDQPHPSAPTGGNMNAAGMAPSPMADDFRPPEDTRFLPPPNEQEAFGLNILQAMIAAAKADGHIDSVEQNKIFEEIGNTDLASDEKAFLFDELKRPLDPDAIGELASTPEMAAEIYAASVVVIGDPNRDERRYLDRLAGRLNLDTGLQDAIEAEAAALPTA